jgi:hypothetical protein
VRADDHFMTLRDKAIHLWQYERNQASFYYTITIHLLKTLVYETISET